MKKYLFASLLMGASMVVTATAEEKKTPLGEQMEEIGHSLKSLRKETDPAKIVAILGKAEEAVLKAIPLVPEKLQNEPDAAVKAKALVEYRKQMAGLYITLCEAEAGTLAGDKAKVDAAFEKLKAEKKEGHDTFMEKKD
jgi:soluble cytochrome b562